MIALDLTNCVVTPPTSWSPADAGPILARVLPLQPDQAFFVDVYRINKKLLTMSRKQTLPPIFCSVLIAAVIFSIRPICAQTEKSVRYLKLEEKKSYRSGTLHHLDGSKSHGLLRNGHKIKEQCAAIDFWDYSGTKATYSAFEIAGFTFEDRYFEALGSLLVELESPGGRSMKYLRLSRDPEYSTGHVTTRNGTHLQGLIKIQDKDADHFKRVEFLRTSGWIFRLC